MVRASHLLSLVALSLCASFLGGCGASATRHSAGPNASLARDDASWCSPEEAQAKQMERAATPGAPIAPSGTTVVNSYRHNKNLRPTKGAIRAAAY